MKSDELLQLLLQMGRATVDVQQPEAETINLMENGRINQLKPFNPGRPRYSVSLDQDGVENLADFLTANFKDLRAGR